MVRLENEPVVLIHGRRPLTSPIRSQGMPIPRGVSQVSEAVGTGKESDPNFEPRPATSKCTLAGLIRRALSFEPPVRPRDLDVSPRLAQFFNPWGYNTAMDC